jgi:hypothetical protein
MESSELTESSVVSASDQVTSTEVDGESVLLDLEEGVYYGLNPVGARIWEEVQEPRLVSDIAEAVTSEYDVERERCLDDILALCADLLENDLIEIQRS